MLMLKLMSSPQLRIQTESNMNVSSLLAVVSHGARKNKREVRDPTGNRCVVHHTCTGVSLTSSKCLVTSDTTYRTGLLDTNCGLRNFQRAV